MHQALVKVWNAYQQPWTDWLEMYMQHGRRALIARHDSIRGRIVFLYRINSEVQLSGYLKNPSTRPTFYKLSQTSPPPVALNRSVIENDATRILSDMEETWVYRYLTSRRELASWLSRYQWRLIYLQKQSMPFQSGANDALCHSKSNSVSCRLL